MKKVLPLLFILFATAAVAQNKDYLVSLEGIGSIKLGMQLPELEKILNTKIKLKVIDVNSPVLTETIKTKYKGINVEIDFWKSEQSAGVNGIKASSPLCKTKSGIGIGSTRLQIIAAYEGYYVDASPYYDYVNEKLIKSRTKSTVTVKEAEEGNAIIFTLLNNKVVSFEVLPIYDDEE